jgi:hypothetical protein
LLDSIQFRYLTRVKASGSLLRLRRILRWIMIPIFHPIIRSSSSSSSRFLAHGNSRELNLSAQLAADRSR